MSLEPFVIHSSHFKNISYTEYIKQEKNIPENISQNQMELEYKNEMEDKRKLIINYNCISERKDVLINYL